MRYAFLFLLLLAGTHFVKTNASAQTSYPMIMSLHPVAGQGFNLALRCADTLARHIAREFEQQRDIGELSTLQSYEQSVIADQQNTADFSHYLTQLFAVDNSLLKVGRGMGLYQLNKHEIAKSLFSQFSMGVL